MRFMYQNYIDLKSVGKNNLSMIKNYAIRVTYVGQYYENFYIQEIPEKEK